jgi:chromate transport protein ChrA
MNEIITEIGKLPVFIQAIIGGIVLFLLFRIFKNALKLLFWLLLLIALVAFVVYYFDIDLTQHINNGV